MHLELVPQNSVRGSRALVLGEPSVPSFPHDLWIGQRRGEDPHFAHVPFAGVASLHANFTAWKQYRDLRVLSRLFFEGTQLEFSGGMGSVNLLGKRSMPVEYDMGPNDYFFLAQVFYWEDGRLDLAVLITRNSKVLVQRAQEGAQNPSIIAQYGFRGELTLAQGAAVIFAERIPSPFDGMKLAS